jgi:hypothetical protein
VKRRRATEVASLAEVNESAKGHTDFTIQSFDGHRLVIVGSFDLGYYHYIELHFVEVAHINCPVWFDEPEFTDEGRIDDVALGIDEPRRFVIRTDEGRHEVIARSVEVVLGMVYYYDRGKQLEPGERIAEWVKRADA